MAPRIKLPDIEIMLREGNIGRESLGQHHASRAAHLPRRRFILLLHGFNVPKKNALPEFDKFSKNINRNSAKIRDDLGWVYWPGDSKMPVLRWLSPTRAMWYSAIVRETPEVGRLLAEYLATCEGPEGRPCKLILVGHSLGCRVILEALKSLSMSGELKSSKIDSIHLILLAAAVPVISINSLDKYKQAIDCATKVSVIHSISDGVLKYIFPIGEGYAYPDDGLPDAVGYEGQPEAEWEHRKAFNKLSHGDYWKDEDVAEKVIEWIEAKE